MTRLGVLSCAVLVVLSGAVNLPALGEVPSDNTWFRHGKGIEKSWNIDRHSERKDWLTIARREATGQVKRERVLVLYPRASSAYDIAITKILQVFEEKNVPAELTIANFEMKSGAAHEAIKFAESNGFSLIFGMGSESTAWLYDNYKGGKIPVVSVCSKDPVQLGQMPDYSSGSKTNFAFTSLNVPVQVQMAYVRTLNPSLRNITILVDGKNISAVQTQAEPIAAYAKQHGMQVIWGEVQEPANARNELALIVRQAVDKMRKSDPDLSKSLIWITGSTSVFREIRTINQNADRVPVLSVVPEIVTAGADSAALAIGVSFESNAHLAAIYAANILAGKAQAGQLKVGVLSPPDIAISFLKTREIGLRVPFAFFENAGFVYDYEGKSVRSATSSQSGQN